jgi:hypothetical protein
MKKHPPALLQADVFQLRRAWRTTEKIAADTTPAAIFSRFPHLKRRPFI